MIAAFRDAFIAAFEYHQRDFVWTNDGVLRTTVMQSYIYPFVARRLGYYLVCELPGDSPRQHILDLRAHGSRPSPAAPTTSICGMARR
jgi:hypothetical protein